MRIPLWALAAIGSAGLLRGQGCETQIIGAQPLPIEQPAQELVMAGADVRVRVIPKLSAATLEAEELQDEAHCQSWQAPRGGRKPNLIVVLVTEDDRKGAIFFGAQWKTALQSRKEVIESDILSAHLQQNDIPGGIAAALVEMHHLILNPPPASAASEEPLPEPSSPVRWMVMAAVALAAGGALLWWIRRRRVQARAERERRAAAQQAAILAKQQATQICKEVSALDASANPPAAAAIAAAVESFHRLGTGPGDPADSTLTCAQYQAIGQQYQSVVLELKRGETILTGKVAPAALSVDQAMSLIIANNRRTRGT